jgi:hypothetical protein
MGLPDDLIYDATLAVNELASNVFQHVLGRGNLPNDPQDAMAGGPELWLYRRGQHHQSQIVCKVFDSQREVRSHVPAQPGPADDLLEHGRGLGIVRALTHAWGCHLTRSRIGGGQWAVPGKAVWFAMRIPPYAAEQPIHLTPAQAAQGLQLMLSARGIPKAIRHDAQAQSVLSVTNGLTVWCRNESFSWTMNGTPIHCPFTDVIEATEQLVRLHEEMSVSTSVE